MQDDGLPLDQYPAPRIGHLCLFDGDFLKSQLVRVPTLSISADRASLVRTKLGGAAALCEGAAWHLSGSFLFNTRQSFQ